MILLVYIDPGTGALVFQAVLSLVLGSALAFRKAIGRILGLFGSRRQPIVATEDEEIKDG